MKVGDGLEDIIYMRPWSREREVARAVLRCSSKPEKFSIFGHRSGIEIFSWSGFYTPAAKQVLMRRPARTRYI